MDNPGGLKLKFARQGDYMTTSFTPGEAYQGYPGVTHGGIIATIMDEVMAQFLFQAGTPVMTAKLEVRYRQAMPADRPTLYRARLTRDARRLFDLEADAVGPSGEVFATARGTYLPLPKEAIGEFYDQR
jgi:acyl-coenzyme A thioesterase PaaI-like protein